MKIIQIAPFYPPHLGGMENVTLGIKNELDNLGIENIVITSDIPHAKQKGVKRIFAKELFHVPFAPNLIWALFQSIKKEDIVHIHQSTAYFPELAFIVARINRAKVVIHNHGGLEPSGLLGFLLPIYNSTINRFILRHADMVLTQNLDYSLLLQKQHDLNPKKCFIFPNGIDERFILKPRDKIHKHGDLRLLFVGRFCKQKNLFLLLQTMKLLERRKFSLTLVGDGELKADILKSITKNNIKRVSYIGKKSKEELVALYKEHDVLILTSIYEGLPLVIVEAMGSGLPVICTGISGVRSFVTEGGILTSFNAEDIAKVCISLKENPKLYRKLSKEAYEKGKKYGWKMLVKENLIPLYQSISNLISGNINNNSKKESN